MNQVLSFDRLVYFGFIFEQSGLAVKNKRNSVSPESMKIKPQVAFGERAMKQGDINHLKSEIAQKYSISPAKIRKAGIEEMLEL